MDAGFHIRDDSRCLEVRTPVRDIVVDGVVEERNGLVGRREGVVGSGLFVGQLRCGQDGL